MQVKYVIFYFNIMITWIFLFYLFINYFELFQFCVV